MPLDKHTSAKKTHRSVLVILGSPVGIETSAHLTRIILSPFFKLSFIKITNSSLYSQSPTASREYSPLPDRTPCWYYKWSPPGIESSKWGNCSFRPWWSSALSDTEFAPDSLGQRQRWRPECMTSAKCFASRRPPMDLWWGFQAKLRWKFVLWVSNKLTWVWSYRYILIHEPLSVDRIDASIVVGFAQNCCW